MRHYLWVVVLVVGMGVAGAYWSHIPLVSGTNVPQPQVRPGAPELLLHFDRTKVIGLEFHRAGNPKIVMTRQ